MWLLLSEGVFGSHGSVGKLVRRHTMDSDAMREASGHGNSSGRHGSGSSTRYAVKLYAAVWGTCATCILMHCSMHIKLC